ncbi:PEGA domain-containing protein [Patescibacteria group bacterium]|nr:PEGA domain-containing protein [Patescibacteria group bacterium]MBU1472539.1 PEGA domain-containing protein [Patescibacteria group bacterium]MBU2460088.1 PEGA domain-containing protein [Patescibacteria group bacterium]MBU2544657.1 PEGA domain-containing protein [Patescibacteria group bacterium]
MFNQHIRSFLIPFITFCLIIGVASGVIAYGRGYRLDLRKNTLKTTGLVSATSDPVGSQVTINDILKTATNNSFTIDPGWYTVRMTKEGYIPWEKKIRVQGEVVIRIDAFLFPTNPSLSPLTTPGVTNPVLSPDGAKIAYVIPVKHLDGTSKKAGLWVYALAEGSLGRNRDPIQIGATIPAFSFETTTISWSPDSTQLLVQTPSGTSRLYQATRLDTFTDISNSVAGLLADWQTERQQKERQKLDAFKQPIVDIATSSAVIVSFSPDETKILYEATASATIPRIISPPLIGTNATEEQRAIEPGTIYVYDAKEDKNYAVMKKTELPPPSPTPAKKASSQPKSAVLPSTLQSATALHWFPTSRHLVLTLPGKIDIMEYDRTNWTTVYSGPFEDGFIAPWPSGSRITVLTNLNPNATTLPNLYTVNLR